MMRRAALRAALGLVRVIAVLVPANTRAQWTAEWSAELEHRCRQQEQERCQAVNRDRRRDDERFTIHCLTPHSDSTWSRDMDLVRRALGALPDAVWLRRQFTLDADALRDAAHGVRMLVKAPAFTVSALFVFALGIGATTAILSL